MINKFLNLTAVVTLALASSVSVASESNSTAVLRAGSDFIYRGQDLTGSQGTVGLGLLFDNVVWDGVYVSGDFDTVEVTPLNDNTQVRTDFQVGYGNVWNDFTYSASLARVLNPVSYAADYTEFRARGQYSIAYVEVGQGLSNDINTDTYFAVGVEGRPFSDKLLLGTSTSFISYDGDAYGASNVEWNNFQVYASYDLWRELDVNAGFSLGGDQPLVGVDDHAWVGASYTF
jgi:hypothetical protein